MTLSLDDLNKFLAEKVIISDESYDRLGKKLADSVKQHLSRLHTPYKRKAKTLYASEVGAPCVRKLYYRYNEVTPDKPLDTATILKFAMGFMLEELLLFLMEEAGYTVTGQQEQIIFDDGMPEGWVVRGRQDAVINGKPVDVKTASSNAMKKFKSEDTLLADDPFGYIPQLGIYSYDEDKEGYNTGYFLVVNKVTGDLEVTTISPDTMDAMMPDFHSLVADMTAPAAPARMPDAMSAPRNDGNIPLSFNCGHCQYKQTCFKDEGGIRSFKYATGMEVHLVNPAKIPRLEEVT